MCAREIVVIRMLFVVHMHYEYCLSTVLARAIMVLNDEHGRLALLLYIFPSIAKALVRQL